MGKLIKCKSKTTYFSLFRSKDEEIELIPVEEFYRDAPESISNPVGNLTPVLCEPVLFSYLFITYVFFNMNIVSHTC